jgi:hypothetical protein
MSLRWRAKPPAVAITLCGSAPTRLPQTHTVRDQARSLTAEFGGHLTTSVRATAQYRSALPELERSATRVANSTLHLKPGATPRRMARAISSTKSVKVSIKPR